MKLLEVQELDSRADQLRHQRAHLPEIAEIAALQTSRGGLEDQARDARIVVDDLTAEQTKVDAEVEQVKARRTRDTDRIEKGLITNPKDLQRMQHELESLQRRIGTLEDDELEVMVRLEEAQSVLDGLAAQVAAADERLAVLIAARDRLFDELDEQLGAVAAERFQAIDGLPEDLLALYERLRASKGGVGAAPLRARQCGGCQLSLDNAELSSIKGAPSDLVVRCEECSRILVRTPESGL